MRLFICLGLVIACLWPAGCQPPARNPAAKKLDGSAETTAGFPCTLTDARGKQVTLLAAPQRIVSLAPSNTEILFDLGAHKKVVGVTSADDYPPEVRRKPDMGSMLSPSIERIVACNPDLVVALGSLNEKAIMALERQNVRLLVLDPKSLTETYDSIRLLGRVADKQPEAEHLTGLMQQRIAQVRQTVLRARRRTKVLMMYQVSPIYTTGPDSFINDLITLAGGQNIVERPVPTNTISAEMVLLKQPDVIICPKQIAARVRLVPGWQGGVPAVTRNRIFPDEEGDATLVRPTPRLVRGAEKLARYLHPELFPPEASDGK